MGRGKMKMTAQEYARRVQKAGPHSPLLADCLWAFCVGGGICLLGEGLRQQFLRQGADAYPTTVPTMLAISWSAEV